MKFSDEFIQKVLDANNIVDFISQYTQLKSTGGGLMGRCPFPDHQEKTPSFSVSEVKQVYHCFGCHKKGNIFSFLRDFQGMNFPEAVEFLATRANIPMPKIELNESPIQNGLQDKKKLISKVNKLAHEHFISNLIKTNSDHFVRKYIQQRGLSEEIIKTFQIGFAPSEWDNLALFLESRKVPLSLAEEARLVRQRSQGKSGFYDLFRGRLIFPILNPMGEAVAFGGRILEKNDEEVKYLNSPETIVFTKGKILYGLPQTAKYIRTEDVAVIVEGYMDVVALYQAGIRNCAASMGTALTSDQCRLVKRITKNVIALFDGDNAGQEAAERSLPILLASDLYPKGVILPDGMDPDDYVKKHGAEKLNELLQSAKDLFLLILEKWMDGYKGEATEKVKLADKLKPVFQIIPDSRLRDLYISEVSQRMGVTIQWLRNALNSNGKKDSSGSFAGGFQNSNTKLQSTQSGANNGRSGSAEGAVSSASNSGKDFAGEINGKIVLAGASKIELTLLSLALKSRANFEIISEINASDFVTHNGVKIIFKKAHDVYGQNQEKFDKLTSLLVTYVDKPELLFSVDPVAGGSGVLGSDFDEERETKLIKDCLRRVKENSLKEQLKKMSQVLKSNPSPENLEAFQKIQLEMSSLLKQNT